MSRSARSDRVRPKIALLITEMQMGGAAKVVRDHACAFRSFADVREIVFNRADGVDFDGEDIVSLDVAGGGSPLKRLNNFVRRAVRYAGFKGEWQPDVSIAHLEGAHYVDLLSRRGEKTILVMHGSIDHNRDIVGLKGWVRRRLLMPLAFRSADAIVAVSRGIAEEVAASGYPKVRVINNFFDADAIAASAAVPLEDDQHALFADRPVIVAMGRLALEKNLTALLAIFARLKARRPVRLLLIGDGPQRQLLVEGAASLGLSVSSPWTGLERTADVHFTGNLSNPFGLLAKANLFVMPSRWEGFPLALCEALACAVPVVAADCPTGSREILAPDRAMPDVPIDAPEPAPFGLLMPIPHESAAATAAWVAALDDLLGDPETRARFAEAGRRRVRDFGVERILPQWCRLVGELVGCRAPGS